MEMAQNDKLIPEMVRAWAVLEERKRILQGKALPGEELRASTAGLQAHSMLKRGKLRGLPAFAFKAPGAIVDVQPADLQSQPSAGGPEPEKLPALELADPGDAALAGGS